MLFVLSSFCLSAFKCDKITEFGIPMMVQNYDVKKGESLCIRSKEPNFGVIFTQIDNTIVTVGESEYYKGAPKDIRIHQNKYGIYVKNYAYINFTAQKDTHWYFTTLTLPKECKDNVWFSNVPGSKFTMSDKEEGQYKFEKGTTTCAVFGPGESQKYMLDITLNEDEDVISVVDDKLINPPLRNGKYEKIPLMHSFFQIEINSRGNQRLVELKTEPDPNIKVSKEFSGFMEPYNLEPNQKFTGIIYIFILLVIVGILVSLYYLKHNKLPFASFFTKSKGVVNLSTTAGPHTLI